MYSHENNVVLLATIRKYKAFIVVFISLILVTYTKQVAVINVTPDHPQSHNKFLISSVTVNIPHYSSSHSERLSAPSFLLKKMSFENVSFKQTDSLFLRFISRGNSSVNLPYASISSILELICILRI